MSLTITKRSNPHPEADRVVQALRSGAETATCTGYGRSHHRRDGGVAGVDHILHNIDVLVRMELPEVQCIHFHRPDGERLWIWSIAEWSGVAFFTRDAVPGHAYFPDGTRGGDAVWVQDADGV
jgi:hypothetical protein